MATLQRGARRALVLAVAAALLAAAPSPGRPARAATASPSEVVIEGFAFSPKTLTVAPGTTVTWVNRDDEPHTIMVHGSPTPLKSPALDTGDSFSFTFDGPGTFQYFCTLHPHMQGVVVVR
jgi:plastocyanin